MKILKYPLVLFLFVLVIFAIGYIQSDDVKTNMNISTSVVDDSIYEINEDLGPNEVNLPVVPDTSVDELGMDEVNLPVPNEIEIVLGEDEVNLDVSEMSDVFVLGPDEVNMSIDSDMIVDELGFDEVNLPMPNETEIILGEDEVIYP